MIHRQYANDHKPTTKQNEGDRPKALNEIIHGVDYTQWRVECEMGYGFLTESAAELRCRDAEGFWVDWFIR
jgi:hypothetical protein